MTDEEKFKVMKQTLLSEAEQNTVTNCVKTMAKP